MNESLLQQHWNCLFVSYSWQYRQYNPSCLEHEKVWSLQAAPPGIWEPWARSSDIYNSVYLAIDYPCVYELIQEQMLVDIFCLILQTCWNCPWRFGEYGEACYYQNLKPHGNKPRRFFYSLRSIEGSGAISDQSDLITTRTFRNLVLLCNAKSLPHLASNCRSSSSRSWNKR